MTLAVLPLQREIRPSSLYVRAKASPIPLYGVASRPCLICEWRISESQSQAVKGNTNHLVLVLHQQLNALYWCSTSLRYSLQDVGWVSNWEWFEERRTAETPPIMKSTKSKWILDIEDHHTGEYEPAKSFGLLLLFASAIFLGGEEGGWVEVGRSR